MTERERSRPERVQLRVGPSGTDENSGLEDVRSHAERLLQTADAAIERALSSNSERFLYASRQEGGQ